MSAFESTKHKVDDDATMFAGNVCGCVCWWHRRRLELVGSIKMLYYYIVQVRAPRM